MSYVYEGRGLVIAVWDPDEFLGKCNLALDESFENMEELENEGWIGDWCSPDNLDGAYLDGDDLDCPSCLVIIKDSEQGYSHADLDTLAQVLGTTPEELMEECEGDVFVECLQ